MRYDVNFILLGLLLVVIVAMIGMVFYYNITYSGLTERYDLAMKDVENKSSELNRTVQEVNAKESLLRERERLLLDYIGELNLSKERETSLGSHFTEVKGQNELLGEQLNDTISERNSYAQLYTKTKTDYDVCQRNYEVKQTELTSEKAKLTNVKGWLVEVTEKSVQISESADSVYNTADEIKASNVTGDVRSLANDIKSDTSSIESDIERIKTIVNQIRNL
ncbi:MAG: hypothetical protein NTU61_00550 [Candidatus Altiarchaeota archaeon]|nr:hypothetical protein [Candidatus Altiarchaeota archaeon]